MDAVMEIHQLTPQFFIDYPSAQYPELMHKQGRPYNCLLIDLHMDYCICIPFRSEIQHKNAYMFKQSVRSQRKKSGLDYSKTVIVTDDRYFSTANAVIDRDEYLETSANIKRITSEIVRYVDDYIAHVTGNITLHSRDFSRRYSYSTLKYFHKELGIE